MGKKLWIWKAGVIALALALVSGTSWAEGSDFGPYQLEAGLSYDSSSNGSDSTLILVEGMWHFKSVAGDGPLRERSFLGHVPYAGGGIGQMSLDFGGGVDGDGIVFGVMGRYADSEIPVAGSLSYRLGTLDFSGVDVDVTMIEAKVGYWVQDNFEAGLMYATTELDGGGGTVETSTIGLYAKTVREMGGKTVNLEASIGQTDYDPDENLVIEIGGDYYLDTGISVGGSLTFESGDADTAEGIGIEVRGTYDLSTMLGFEAHFGLFMASDSGTDDTTEIGVGVSYRK